jgi:hypothetical protein
MYYPNISRKNDGLVSVNKERTGLIKSARSAIMMSWQSERYRHGPGWRVAWPPGHNVEVKCLVCERSVRRMLSDIRPGQRQACSPACRDLMHSLFWPMRIMDSSRTVKLKDRGKR